jgi:hypothetical protein
MSISLRITAKPLASLLVRGAAVAIFLLVISNTQGQTCRVLDPELQGTYAGPCVNGLAEGEGFAAGTAEYRGGFRAGRKHGKGVKTWPNGDRYEGEFAADARHGAGTYVWGRGPWAGERYEGGYANDRRHGFGTYRWQTGDLYAGPWENDTATGPPTPMMQARAQFEEEARRAVGKVGTRVCREMPVGIGHWDWVAGTVVSVSGSLVGIRIEQAGKQPHAIAGAEVRQSELVWDAPLFWTPCL